MMRLKAQHRSGRSKNTRHDSKQEAFTHDSISEENADLFDPTVCLQGNSRSTFGEQVAAVIDRYRSATANDPVPYDVVLLRGIVTALISKVNSYSSIDSLSIRKQLPELEAISVLSRLPKSYLLSKNALKPLLSNNIHPKRCRNPERIVQLLLGDVPFQRRTKPPIPESLVVARLAPWLDRLSYPIRKKGKRDFSNEDINKLKEYRALLDTVLAKAPKEPDLRWEWLQKHLPIWFSLITGDGTDFSRDFPRSISMIKRKAVEESNSVQQLRNVILAFTYRTTANQIKKLLKPSSIQPRH